MTFKIHYCKYNDALQFLKEIYPYLIINSKKKRTELIILLNIHHNVYSLIYFYFIVIISMLNISTDVCYEYYKS
ncbi:hypothetical protein F3K33_11620 [Clostridium diolis]|nr:hypothetical protein F3K33_11620 [Clostridium diolis]